ncbi:MAG: hypothetical protein EB127_04540 [Alphaproteobacteria bacterium]|nr:hypothetical protein [Alphaproteobacteria bacterium]
MLEGYSFWGTTNIKVASAVATFGAKIRKIDPVTHIIKENGEKQITFWFESGDSGNVKKEMEAKWNEMTCDEESPIRYVRAALENRETLLGLVKKAEPMQIVEKNNQTLFIPVNATAEKKLAILRAI